MPREVVTLQVGQAGNQVGCRFWELALREHAAASRGARYDEPLSAFFANVDARCTPPALLPLGDGRGAIRTLRVRAARGGCSWRRERALRLGSAGASCLGGHGGWRRQ